MAEVFLLRELVDGANKFSKVVGERDELRKTHTLLTLNKGTEREVTIVMERHHVHVSPFDPTGLVPSFCEHGLQAHPVTGELPHSQGRSWVKSRLLTMDMSGVTPKVRCHCEHSEPCGPECTGPAQ